jgi:hypothetical protein
VGARVDRWQAAIAEWNRGHDPDLDAGRLCADWRPELVFKHVDGSEGEENCFSLLDAPQCAPNPCWRHSDNPCTRWEGDMGSHWGSAGAFRSDWLLRTPAATWNGIVHKYYGDADFCNDRSHEWEGAQRRAICSANSEAGKVVLYAQLDPEKGRLSSVSGVALDLRIPEAREWNARRLLSHLKSLGIDPGESACVVVGYKPGIWSRYDGPGAGRHCPADEANSWSGFLTPRNARSCPAPRPLVPTPYGPGEFEAAMNEQMRSVFRLLDQPAPAAMQRGGSGSASYAGVRFVFTERPDTRGQLWWIWRDDVRQSPRVLGEMDNQPTGIRGR